MNAAVEVSAVATHTALSDGSVCLHDLFEAQVDRNPDRPAITWGDQTVSYGELDRRANQLARRLRRLGVDAGDLVAIYFERSINPILAMLACFKAGAGYVPLDPIYPVERIRFILQDAGVAALLTEQALSPKAKTAYDGRIVLLDRVWEDIAGEPTTRLSKAETGASPNHLAYVIYTSGTTGRPKGVMTEHRSVVHFVSAFNQSCGVTEVDRIYQGFSPTFDGSVEEMWMAFAHGASLIIGNSEMARIGSEVGRLLNDEKATILSTVPTMLSTIDVDLPSVRLLIVSGEVCTPDVVRRWATPGRSLLNVYGPTETTVNTTCSVCLPEQPITIGRPLPGYLTYILDETLHPVADGEQGELYIGGPGLARGYLNLPDQTQARFIPNPIESSREASPRLYRTGDLARVGTDGNIEFLGRLDGQVKVRGFRVELAEIEEVLREDAGVRAAAARVVDRGGPQLAGYVTLNRTAGSLDRTAVLQRLRDRLPDYMVPAYLDVLDEFPTLTSGKIDRRALPEPVEPLVVTNREITPPRTDAERRMLAIWERVLKVSPISVTDNFFTDLGGHSLLAGQTVSELRRELGLEVAVRDVYRCPTVEQLAAQTTATAVDEPGEQATPRSSRTVFHELSWWTRSAVTVLQAASMYVLYFLMGWPTLLLVGLVVGYLLGWLTLVEGIVWLVVLLTLAYPAILLLSVAAKWLLIGRYRPGRYPVWGFYFFRWWLVEHIQAASNPGWMSGTPMLNVYFRLMGATVGRGALIDSPHCSAFDLVSIGRDTAIGADTHLLGYRVEDGMLVIGSVTIGDECYVGIHSSLGLNTTMGNGARLGDLSVLGDDETIPGGESRSGSPAIPAAVELPRVVAARRLTFLFGLCHFLVLSLLDLVMLIASLPALVILLIPLLQGSVVGVIVALLLSGPLQDLTFCLVVAAYRAVVWHRPKPGVYPVDSIYYVRKWSADFLMSLGRSAMLPLYTTLYLPPWFRLLGARIGPRAELSTVWQVSPELLDIGEESFLADGVVIGRRRLFAGQFQIAGNRIGRRTFVGNNSLMPVGTSLGNNSLLGVLSMPPADGVAAGNDMDWLGSPAFRLPARLKVGGFDDGVTYRPSKRLYALRLFIDGIRIVFPGLIGSVGLVFWVLAAFAILTWWGVLTLVLCLPVISFCMAILECLAVVLMKVAFMGRFRPVIKPLWSVYVWLNEAVNGSYETVASSALAPLLGTPFVAPFLRLFGCKIGRHVFIESILFSEFDLIEVGDHSALNIGSVLQTHLFEDRIMKSSHVKVEAECSVGNHAVVLYDTLMQPGAKVAPLSLVMKGEILPPFTSWSGIPIGSQQRSVGTLPIECPVFVPTSGQQVFDGVGVK